jgi:hypothetical protein
MKQLYLDDNSKEDEIDYELIKNNIILTDSENENEIEMENEKKIKKKSEVKPQVKPQVNLKPDYNSKGEKIVVFSINIPLKHNNDSITIDILINSEMYKKIGTHFKY